VLKILCAGEVMVEFAASNGVWQQSYGGDTFNTAIYLAREGMKVDYLTYLGDDRFSNSIMSLLETEKVGTACIGVKSGRQPGLYTIHNDQSGEREFSYWRQHSPVRELFDIPYCPPEKPGVFYFSGITLAVTRSGFSNLVEYLRALREQNCQIIFDPNYRLKLWDSVQEAQGFYRLILKYCNMVLPTLEDETLLWGVENVEQCRAFYENYQVQEIVIKAPEYYCHVFADGKHIKKQAEPVNAIDTTGAGDSFNAGYIAARCSGESIEAAIEKAQKLSAQVVLHAGAVLPRD
jgi:2-dehydro-3-deoxygluconokinase